MAKVAIITGTSRGIGRDLARTYLDRGLQVAGCARSKSDIESENYHHTILDVGDEKAVIAMVGAVAKKHGGIDYLINNAGVASMNHALLTPTASVEEVFRTNMFGTFNFSREAAKRMKRKKFGRIVNFSSVAVPFRLEGEAVYAAAKSSIEMFSRIFAREIAPYGITCNVVAPSPVETDLIRHIPPEKIEALLRRQAIREFGTFEDVRNIVDFFLDDKSSMITGQVLYLGGVG